MPALSISIPLLLPPLQHHCPYQHSFIPLNNVISKLSGCTRLLCMKGVSRHESTNRKEDRQRDFNIRERPPFPKSVFAAGTAKITAEYQKKRAEAALLIKGFSRSERWKEALSHPSRGPSQRNYGDAVVGAVLHCDGATAGALYAELMEKGLIPNQETWQALFQCGLSHQDNQIYPMETLAKDIKAWFESWSTVDPRGLCLSCQAELEFITQSQEEYTQLKDRVMGDVIQGSDVLNETTPEELESFKNFVKWKPAFDRVIDGFSVANMGIKGNQSQMLLVVVSELERQGLVILVLWRKHMQRPSLSWDRHDMSLVQQKAHCFFTDISEDDPFLLRDLMRDHKACLPDGATRRLFFKWQRGISSYDTIVQTNGGSCHIHYDENGAERYTYLVPQKWLCLTRVK
uniref:ribonuclease P n=1 Tax=Salmo trutta TaxID=8032 RepID=A0A673XS88_SALTR